MKTHPLNVSYLVVGLVFLGLAGSWGLRESGAVDLSGARWLMPATLLAAGAIGLVAFATKGASRNRSQRAADGPENTNNTNNPDNPGNPGNTEGDLR